MWKKYWKVRNKVGNIRSARKDFEIKIADYVKENPKKIFAYMKYKIKSRQGIGDICIDSEDSKSKVTQNDKEKANIFFASVQTDEKGELLELKTCDVTIKMPPLVICKDEVTKILKNLKPNKAAGINKIYPRILREVAEEIVDIVLMIFNDSILKIEVPSEWLQAIIAV